jgi:alpha-glucosidase
MIGGGEIGSFWGNQNKIDQDLLVRSAQCHALMPMMQFSVAPWRVLDSIHFAAVKKVLMLREKMMPMILNLALSSAATGEPIVKFLEYVFPNQGLSGINDQFLLGDSLMVAPMIKPNSHHRTVHFPVLTRGKWVADDGKIYPGGSSADIIVPLNRLPYFAIRTK